MALATVYQKHSSVLTLKVDVYRMTPARCRKVKEVGHPFGEKLTTEAPVNGGRNYNGSSFATLAIFDGKFKRRAVVKSGYMLEHLGIS